jgi:SAM-dependent methyltransferase
VAVRAAREDVAADAEVAVGGHGKLGVVLGRRLRTIWHPAGRPWEGAPARWGPNTGHPNEAARNRVAYRQLSAALEYAAQRYAQGILLDIGCGAKPWRETFAAHVNQHIGADHDQTLHGLANVDLVCDAYSVPLPDESVDTALLTEVLEHLQRPLDALVECRRLLKPGGHVIATTPFSWPLHEAPRDFFRYSPYALQDLSARAGMEVVEVRPLSGFWTTIALHFSYALQRHRPRAPGLVDFMSVASQRCAWAVERIDFQEALSWNHLLIARRP